MAINLRDVFALDAAMFLNYYVNDVTITAVRTCPTPTWRPAHYGRRMQAWANAELMFNGALARYDETYRARGGRAMAFLHRHLTGPQQWEFDGVPLPYPDERYPVPPFGEGIKSFPITAKSGFLYRVWASPSANITVHTPQGLALCAFCSYVEGLPLGDWLLTQKLMLESDEDEFLRIANVINVFPSEHTGSVFGLDKVRFDFDRVRHQARCTLDENNF